MTKSILHRKRTEIEYDVYMLRYGENNKEGEFWMGTYVVTKHALQRFIDQAFEKGASKVIAIDKLTNKSYVAEKDR